MAKDDAPCPSMDFRVWACLTSPPGAALSSLPNRQPDLHEADPPPVDRSSGCNNPSLLRLSKALRTIGRRGAQPLVSEECALASIGRIETRRGALIRCLSVGLPLLLVLAGACGRDTDDDPQASPSSRSLSSSSSTSTHEDPSTTTSSTPQAGGSTSSVPDDSSGTDHQAIVDAYVGYWDARFAANTGTPDPDDPALERYATGAQLEAVIAETRANLEQGTAFEAAPQPVDFRRVRVVEVEGDRAEVQECFVDDGRLVERGTGTVINDTVATQSVIGTLRYVDGAWKVSETKLIQRWEGVAGCALGS